MRYSPFFARDALSFRPLSERKNDVQAPRDMVDPDAPVAPTSREMEAVMPRLAAAVRNARTTGRPVMTTFGAHTIKNGLGPVLNRLIESGWLTHLATSGAGIIHDWELAFQGATGEAVRANVADGDFGAWEETGRHLNLALLLGAYAGLGYGESVGRLIVEERHVVPTREELRGAVTGGARAIAHFDSLMRAAAAADVLDKFDHGLLQEGETSVPHAARALSVQACAYRHNLSFTGHPIFGHDTLYAHPMSCGAAIGRAAELDFLRFVSGVSLLGDGGVYISAGSPVMSPMIFERALSMARNRAREQGRDIENFSIYVVDLAPSMDSAGESLRDGRTFARMGGGMTYLSADNRVFFPLLLQMLR